VSGSDPDVSWIGRSDERGVIEQVLDRSHEEGRALILLGEPGMGKSTVWRWGVSRAQARGFRTIGITAPASSQRLPYAALSELLGPSLDRILPSLPDPQRLALESALGLAEVSVPDPRAVALATASTFKTIARDGPTVMAIDDAQWVDPDSAQAIAFALRRMANEPLVFLAALRTSDRSHALVLRDLPTSWAEEIGLVGLPARDVRRLLHQRVGLAVPMPLARRIAAATQGNPLFVIEIGFALVAANHLPTAEEALPGPAAVTEMFSGRLEQLSTDRWDLLRLLALEERIDHRTLLAALGATRGRRSFAEVAEVGIVRSVEGEPRLVHPLIASEVIRRSDTKELASAHLLLSVVLDDPEAKLRHRAAAQTDPDVFIAGELEALASDVARRGAPESAADLLERSARLSPDGRDRRTRLLRAAEHHLAGGDIPRAITLLEELIDETESGQLRAKALLRLIDCIWNDLARARTLAEEALRDAGDDPILQVQAHDALAWAILDMEGPTEQAWLHLERERELADASGDPRAQAIAYSALGEAQFYEGDGAWRASAERAMQAELALGGVPTYASPRILSTWRLIVSGEATEARQLLEGALHEARAVNAITFLWGPLLGMAELSMLEGRLQDAAEFLAEGSDLALSTNMTWPRLYALTDAAMLEALTGRLQDAERDALEALEIAERAEHLYWLMRNRATLGQVALLRGDATAATQWLDPIPEMCREAGVVDPSLESCWPELFVALVDSGALARAESLANDLSQRSAPLGYEWARGCALVGLGSVAAAEDRIDDAIQSLEEALTRLPGDQRPLARAWAWLELGRARRRLGQKRATREALEEALSLFHHVKATHWIERVHEELSRIGGPASLRHDLTGRETRVAELVAAGLTNREIAADLFLSVKTVEANVARIKRKLGVSSRQEIAPPNRVEL
jgi:DNA-binding CsgD family transcriptional regulator